MHVIGIIAEYNPFHNGHLYHINKIKELYPDSLLVLVTSGYFTQRGHISVLDKETKTRIALDNNIDIVLELPVIYSTQSSDIFAHQAITILNELKIDTLVFGSESNDIELLKSIVNKQSTKEYEDKVKQYLDEGVNYPTAMSKALELPSNITTPNDLLGISYIKAINKINPNIKPITIKRTTDYHDIQSNDEIVSATNIREKLYNGEDIIKFIPNYQPSYINNISNDKLFNLLKFKILTDNDLSIYLDVDEGIEYRLKRYINESNSFDELISNVKTKRYTYNKINRMLIHILLGLTKKDNDQTKLDYIKILGFNKLGQQYLKDIRKDITLSTTHNKDSLIYNYELKAAYLYEQATKKSLNNFDNKNIPIIKD